MCAGLLSSIVAAQGLVESRRCPGCRVVCGDGGGVALSLALVAADYLAVRVGCRPLLCVTSWLALPMVLCAVPAGGNIAL